MRLYCMFEFGVRGIPFCSIVFTATPHERHESQIRVLSTIYSTLSPYQHQKKYPNSLTGNVIFVITNSCTYEITHADVWVCRWRNHALFCSIVFTVTLRTWSSVMISQISDRLTNCSAACLGWDQKKHRNSLIRDVIICTIEIVFKALLLQWHNLSVTTFQTLSRLTFVQQYALAYGKGTSALSHWRRSHL